MIKFGTVSGIPHPNVRVWVENWDREHTSRIGSYMHYLAFLRALDTVANATPERSTDG
jgi:hypothetical protein